MTRIFHPDAIDLEDSPPLSPPASRDPTPKEAEWLGATNYEIVLERQACYGTCAVFTATFRSSGILRFTGGGFVWKPGTYEVPQSTDELSALYADLILRGFLDLQPKYRTADDGCPEVWTDHPTSIFKLRAGGREKTVEYYHGCEGDFPVLDTLYAIERQIILTGDLARFIQGGHEVCYRRKVTNPADLLEASYVIRDAQKQAVGILRFDLSQRIWERPWTVANCEGEKLAGEAAVKAWDCSSLLVPTADLTFRWPGSDRPLSAVELTVPYDASNAHTINLRLITLEDEAAAYAERGDSCR